MDIGFKFEPKKIINSIFGPIKGAFVVHDLLWYYRLV